MSNMTVVLERIQNEKSDFRIILHEDDEIIIDGIEVKGINGLNKLLQDLGLEVRLPYTHYTNPNILSAQVIKLQK
jgi:hypothetical protein